MQELKNAINLLLKNNNLETGLRQNKALLIWESVVGKNIGENTTPDRVEHGVLTLRLKVQPGDRSFFLKNTIF